MFFAQKKERKAPETFEDAIAGINQLLDDLQNIMARDNALIEAMEDEKARLDQRIAEKNSEANKCASAINNINKVFMVN